MTVLSTAKGSWLPILDPVEEGGGALDPGCDTGRFSNALTRATKSAVIWTVVFVRSEAASALVEALQRFVLCVLKPRHIVNPRARVPLAALDCREHRGQRDAVVAFSRWAVASLAHRPSRRRRGKLRGTMLRAEALGRRRSHLAMHSVPRCRRRGVVGSVALFAEGYSRRCSRIFASKPVVVSGLALARLGVVKVTVHTVHSSRRHRISST